MKRRTFESIGCLSVLACFFSFAVAEDSAAIVQIELEQIISREDPKFNCERASLTIGRDGMVYLTSAGQDNGYILRVSRDGRDKLGGASVPAIHNATADADGLIASSNGHFSHQVAIYDPEFRKVNAVTDFLVNDQVGWDAPASVEVDAGGDFYALDHHRDRILRINAEGKIVQAHALPHFDKSPAQGFRVCEKTQTFYVIFAGKPLLHCLGFDGKLKWQQSLGVSTNTYDGDHGGFDVDADGVLHAIGPHDNVIRKIGLDGKLVGKITLDIPLERKPAGGIHGMRLFGGDVVLRGRHPSELFQVYDLSTGRFTRSVSIDHERLAVTAQGGPWIAGRPVDFKIDFDGGGRRIQPKWRVWARPFGTLGYRELRFAGGRLQVPEDLAGIYQIKVTPETTPWQRGAVASEYKVQTLVEVRAAGAQGSVAAATELNRVFFGRGEEIPLAFHMRGTAAKDTDLTITVRDGSLPLATAEAKFDAAAGAVRFTLPGSFTARLRPGTYTVDIDGEGLTCVNQRLVIGPGIRPSPLLLMMMYGDYRPTYPQANAWDTPDIATAWARRSARLGFNLMVDRLGHPLQRGAFAPVRPLAEVAALARLLEADPRAVSPEKLHTLPTMLQAMSGYGAHGISQMAILMGMDAGLPLGGPGFDSRKPDQVVEDLTATTEALRDYPAFRGWSWSSNWWVFGQRGAAAAETAQEKSAYETALKNVSETGVWDDVLDRVANRRLSYAVDAQAKFNKRLEELAPAAVTAVACPFRNVESYPPITLSNVEEVDLQSQWEQIAMPYHGPFSVDFYKRPGKKAWGHPEVWNDAGTGDQILTTLWQMIMRGADGVGCSDHVPQWQFALAGNTDDPRISWNGITSVYRNLNAVLNRYGPWFTSMQNDDRVAIVASGRMYKIDEWVGATGRHFARVMEAYVACLHAHRPASIVFAEDIGPDTLKNYEAVLIVGQTVEPEPTLAAALKDAQDAGVAIFADGTCRPELVEGFTQLGLSFDHFEKDPSLAADDHACWRTAAYAKAAAPILTKALATVRPAAEVDNPEVFVTERRSEKGRYLFVVDNTTLGDLEPGHLWRVSLACANLVPQVVPVKLNLADGQIVYDVFAGKQVQPVDGTVQADCRNMPARVYAMLPAAIARVQVKGPKSIRHGRSMRWEVQVQDVRGRTIAAAVPVRVSLLAADGTVLDRQFVSASSSGAVGRFMVPINVPTGHLTLEAVELLSGKVAALKIAMPEVKFGPLNLAALAERPVDPPVAPDNAAVSDVIARNFSPAAESFGPHVRDLVVTDGGKLAIVNTMNWDHNLYGLDLQTGKVRWRQRAGHYFAFEPMALPGGVAVQGFDLLSAEGYHLYLVGNDGRFIRRFALYGLPQRLPHRFIPALVRDHVNSFAVGDGGNWVAAADDLGLAVWNADGRVLWQQDWFEHERHIGKVVALDAATLLVIEGMTATAYGATDGKRKWRQSVGRSGEIRIARVSTDSETCVLYNTADGGKLVVLRDGRIVRVIPAAAEDVSLSDDGSMIGVVSGNLLKLYSVTDGLQWIFHGDDLMHSPRFSGDGRLAAASSMGTVYVTDLQGRLLMEKDIDALAVPAWLPGGGLLLANWEGTVCRLDKNYAQRWRTRLTPEAVDMRGKILADDDTPTTRIGVWGNATEKPAKLSENLLAETAPMIRLVTTQRPMFLTETPDQKAAMLYDGEADAAAEPWIPWDIVGTFAETSPVNYIEIDAFRTQMKVTGVTLVEDPDHPESWLRDASIEYWDAGRELWTPIQPLLSNSAVHTHMFAEPVEAARFRLMLPWGVCGNLRLAEIVFHGQLRGCSHPDVVARRPLAVLFDEQEDIRHDLHSGGNLSLALHDAFSGGRCLTLTPSAGERAGAGPPWQHQFGHTIRNWDFEIAENPRPGQYRYLQFAWKAQSPQTKGITLRLAESYYGGYGFAAGAPTSSEGATIITKADSPPKSWQVVRVDLWEVAKKPWRIRSLFLNVIGGGAAVDRIVLVRAESDLPHH